MFPACPLVTKEHLVLEFAARLVTGLLVTVTAMTAILRLT